MIGDCTCGHPELLHDPDCKACMALDCPCMLFELAPLILPTFIPGEKLECVEFDDP